MNKFKIGDKIRISWVTSDDVATKRYAVGDVLTVDEDSFCPWCIDKNGKRIAASEDKAELVTKDETMKNIILDGVEYTPVKAVKPKQPKIKPGQVWTGSCGGVVITDEEGGYSYLNGRPFIHIEERGSLHDEPELWEYVGLASEVITINK